MISGSLAKGARLGWLILVLGGCGQQGENGGEDSKEGAHSPALAFRAPREFVPGPKLAGTDPKKAEFIREWSRFTLTMEYQRCGKTNAVWDADAMAALEAAVEGRMIKSVEWREARISERIEEGVGRAVAAGCDDPLIRYLHARFVLTRQEGMNNERLAEAYGQSADAMENTDYAPIRKMYANLFAARAMKATLGTTKATPARLTALRRAAVHHLNEALHDPNLPPSEASDAVTQIWAMAGISTVGRYDIEGLIIPTLEKRWSRQAFTYWLMGKFYTKKAWRDRGDGWAPTVTAKGWEGFEKNLKIAESHLRKGWEMDPTDADVPIAMITVCMGRGHPRAEMERWFERAMKIDANSWEAVSAKAYYLEPKWEGSDQELIGFGRECVANKAWGGRTPLILRSAHQKLQRYYEIPEDRYYSRPSVWRDVRASYERFFEANPMDVSYRHNYASDAFRSGQYEIFLEQLPKFTTGTNYAWFGGKEEFEKMVEKALAAVKR